MGLSSGINFITSFDADLRALRDKVQAEREEPALTEETGPRPMRRPMLPSDTGPNLRLVPSLDYVPDF